MSIDSNSECVRSKFFTGQTDMDESLSDFQEAKKSCKGPKPAQIPAKPKTRKVTKRIKGQKDIRTALKGKKNELISYSKEFDTVCKKSGLDVDSEQLQLAIALSKSLQTESSNPETSHALSSQQRVAKIRKTLQEYGFKVPEAKITTGKKTKKYRKKYKLLTVTEEEKHQNITAKYTRILFGNPDHSKVEQDSSNNQESECRVFYIASSIPYECMKDNNLFYVDNLAEKSTTNGSLLRDWSEIPGRPESPKLIDTFIMNFQETDCSQDELDIILSGPIKYVKDIFASKEIEYRKKYKKCDVPKIVIEDEVKVVSDDDDDDDDDDNNDHKVVAKNKSPFQKAFNMESPVKIVDIKSPVKRLFEDNTPVNEEIETISPIKPAISNSPSKEVIDVETINKLTFTQQCRSCSPDIFDDELSSIMETTKPKIVLSQDHKTKVFSQEIMDLTQCANVIQSQNSEKGIQLSQNVTKRRSNDFMEITECIVGSSQPVCEELKEIDLTVSPEDKGATVGRNHSINIDNNVENVSTDLYNDAEQNSTDSNSRNIIDQQQITVLSNYRNTDSHQTAKENIDLTQSSIEDDKGIPIEENIQTSVKKAVESMDLTQSSNSTDISLPLVDVANSQSQASLDDTIIVDKDEYIANAKVKKSIVFNNEVHSQVFDLTQAQDTSIEYNPSPVKVGNTESCSNSFYEDFVHDHSENTENSKEIEQQNTDVSKEQNNSSPNESKESNDNIDLTQGSSTSEEILSSQRPITILENIPNNSSLGKQDDVSIDYDEIIIEDNICENKSFQKSAKNSNSPQNYDSSKSQVHNDVEIGDVNNDNDLNSSQNSEVFQISDKELDHSLHKSRSDFSRDNFNFPKGREKDKSVDLNYDSSKSEIHNDVEIVDENNDIIFNSSQNSEVFQISDKEFDYSLYKSKCDFQRDNFDFGGISILDNVTKLGSYRKSLSEGCQPYFTEHKNDTLEDSFLPEVYVNKTENKIIETTQLDIDKAEGISPIKVQEVLKSNNGIIKIKTPKNSEYIIKTVDVTPMADYASMSTPQRNRELNRYGLKPFKRKRAIQILTHLYNQTHPTIQQLVDEDQPSPSKKPRANTYTQESPQKLITSPENLSLPKTPVTSPIKFVYKKQTHETRLLASPRKTDDLKRAKDIFSAPSPIKPNDLERDRNILSAPSKRKACSKTAVKSSRKFIYKKPTHETRLQASPIKPDELERQRDILSVPSSSQTDEIKGVTDVCGYEVTSEVAVVKSVDCSPDDWVFQKREKAKVHSCRVPLHIAFHNYLLSRRSLREAILKYEPVDIDVIHKDLVGYGHRYDPKDLLKFLDKKCITVKTTDNNARNNKR